MYTNMSFDRRDVFKFVINKITLPFRGREQFELDSCFNRTQFKEQMWCLGYVMGFVDRPTCDVVLRFVVLQISCARLCVLIEFVCFR